MHNEEQIDQMTLDIFRELGSGGMFVSSEDFVAEHSGRIGDIAIYGQELNTTTWRLAKMNMAIRGIDADIRQGDTLQDDKLRDLKFDYILANPPKKKFKNRNIWKQAI